MVAVPSSAPIKQHACHAESRAYTVTCAQPPARRLVKFSLAGKIYRARPPDSGPKRCRGSSSTSSSTNDPPPPFRRRAVAPSISTMTELRPKRRNSPISGATTGPWGGSAPRRNGPEAYAAGVTRNAPRKWQHIDRKVLEHHGEPGELHQDHEDHHDWVLPTGVGTVTGRGVSLSRSTLPHSVCGALTGRVMAYFFKRGKRISTTSGLASNSIGRKVDPLTFFRRTLCKSIVGSDHDPFGRSPEMRKAAPNGLLV